MTVSEATKNGYSLCGYADREFQTLIKISDLCEEDFEMGKIMIASMDATSPTVDEEDVRERIADLAQSDWCDNTPDDTDEVYNIVNKLDFSEMVNKINQALSENKIFMLTDIELTKDPK